MTKKYVLELNEEELEYLHEYMDYAFTDISKRLMKKVKKYPYTAEMLRLSKSILDKLNELKK